MFTNDNDFDPDDRLCEPPAGTPIVGELQFPIQCPGGVVEPLQLIEICFGLLVYITDTQKIRFRELADKIAVAPWPITGNLFWTEFHELVDTIVKAPYNQPRHGVHWVSGEGSRPNFSAIDAAILGIKPGPASVEDGEEPTFDNDVYQVCSTARGFLSERERARVEKERAAT